MQKNDRQNLCVLKPSLMLNLKWEGLGKVSIDLRLKLDRQCEDLK